MSDTSIYIILLAEQCSRYEDMIKYLRKIIDNKTDDITTEERKLLALAYKNLMSQKRQGIHALLAYEQKESLKSNSIYINFVKKYKFKILKELEGLCNDIVQLVDKRLFPKAKLTEPKVFYFKMKADSYRYMIECVSGDEKKKYTDLCLASYKSACDMKDLDNKNPLRYGLALNYSLFIYEVLKIPNDAIKTAAEAMIDLKKIIEDDKSEGDLSSLYDSLNANLEQWKNENPDIE